MGQGSDCLGGDGYDYYDNLDEDYEQEMLTRAEESSNIPTARICEDFNEIT